MNNIRENTNMKEIDFELKRGARSGLSELAFLELEIKRWKKSKQRKDMLTGERYYVGDHDILKRKREVIGRDGKLEVVENLPNNKIVDNQYAIHVDKKVNYLLGQKLTFETQNKVYADELEKIFNRSFHQKLKKLGKGMLSCGISWLYVYYDESGELAFKRFDGHEVLPFWADNDHTVLEMLVRVYEVETCEGDELKIIERAEVYKPDGVSYYTLTSEGKLIPDIEKTAYLTLDEKPYNWEQFPVIPVKRNDYEIPLITQVKSLQDGINVILSDFENNMQEDHRNTILVLTNYDGENLAEFRHNLALYGSVKVRDNGGVSTLQVEVNSENYKAILELFNKKLIENAKSFDAKDERTKGTPNQMNIQSMFADIDLDANEMETELQASFEQLLWFVNHHLLLTTGQDYSNEKLNIIFNRDMMMNEAEIIDSCNKSSELLSKKTLIAQHPWITDVEGELEQIKTEKAEAIAEYEEAFMNYGGDSGDDEKEDK